ncbi:MAG: hypothetical protein EOO45_02970 [Flavobacterium sp.]|nr:MAG: hypothetical protein EOO45_02970 [Flavobacterium sp.]
MKKIIAMLAITLAFGLNANAQEKVTKVKTPREKTATVKADSPEIAAMNEAIDKDVQLLSSVVKLDDQGVRTFTGLFRNKHKVLSQKDLSDERKTVLAESIDAKIKATLTPEQNVMLSKKPDVLKQLTH